MYVVLTFLVSLLTTIVPVSEFDWRNNTTELPYTGAVMPYATVAQFERTIELRQGWGQLQDECDYCVGYAAMPRIQDMGRVVEVCTPEGVCSGPLWVVDVAGLNDFDYLNSVNWAIDIDPVTFSNLFSGSYRPYSTVTEWRDSDETDVEDVDDKYYFGFGCSGCGLYGDWREWYAIKDHLPVIGGVLIIAIGIRMMIE